MSSLVGLDRNAGRAMMGVAHVRQSITDILTTPVGGRVMRPAYGSHLPRMVDLPVSKGWISAVQAEVARALMPRVVNGRVYGEPRLKLQRVTVVSVIDGQVNMTIAGEYQGESVLLEVVA